MIFSRLLPLLALGLITLTVACFGAGPNSCEFANDGVCDEPKTCKEGTDSDDCDAVTCTPDCQGRVCGLDPVCGTSCGSCTDTETCSTAGLCESTASCQPDCVDLKYTSCTCGSDDPCSWQEDGTCDSACEQVAPGATFDDSVDCACIPDCGSRECGLDPVCGAESCGSCSTGTCDATGVCVSDGNWPTIFAFNADPDPAHPFSAIFFTVVARDADGTSDLASAEMVSSTGVDYGSLPWQGTAFGVELSWDEINALEPIVATDPAGIVRTFTVTVRDQAGHSVTATDTLTLKCASATSAVCEAGVCADLMTNVDHCGACANPVGNLGACVDGLPECGSPFYAVDDCGGTCRIIENDDLNCGACDRSCPGIATSIGAATGTCLGQQCNVYFVDYPVRESCDALCASGGMICPSASGTSADYATADGANTDTRTFIGCATVPPEIHPTYSALSFVGLDCECRG